MYLNQNKKHHIKSKWIFYFLIFLFVISILFISMIGFTIPNDRIKISNVKVNMHKLESILEKYKEQENKYPNNIEELEKYLKKNNSNSSQILILNPFTKKQGKGESFDNLKKLFKKNNDFFYGKEGIVYYNPIIKSNGVCIKYFIYGGGSKNELILKNNENIPFTISNN